MRITTEKKPATKAVVAVSVALAAALCLPQPAQAAKSGRGSAEKGRPSYRIGPQRLPGAVALRRAPQSCFYYADAYDGRTRIGCVPAGYMPLVRQRTLPASLRDYYSMRRFYYAANYRARPASEIASRGYNRFRTPTVNVYGSGYYIDPRWFSGVGPGGGAGFGFGAFGAPGFGVAVTPGFPSYFRPPGLFSPFVPAPWQGPAGLGTRSSYGR